MSMFCELIIICFFNVIIELMIQHISFNVRDKYYSEWIFELLMLKIRTLLNVFIKHN